MGRSENSPEESLQRRLLELEDANQRLESELGSLRERANSFEALAENAASGLMIAVTPERHVYANRRASEITGYTTEELLNLGVVGVAGPNAAPELQDNFRRRLAGEALPLRYETTLRHKDGHTIPVELAPTLTVWNGQKANMVVVRDLTQTRQALLEAERANAALAESEQRYRQLVEVSPYCIVLSVQGRLVFVNPAGVELLGAESEQSLLDKRVLDFPLPEYHELVADRMRRLVESAETAPPVEVRIQRLDGRVIDVEVLTVTTPYQGEPGFQLVIRDVTQERRNEQRQQRINAALCAVLIIADELMRCHDADELLRRAVELARERLGLERCSLHLVDGAEMCGTFGTNLQGETTDEREHRYAGGDYWATIRQTLPGSPHWGVLNQPYREWTGDEMDTLAGTEGATIFTVVQAENEPLAVFYNDYAISGRPVDPNLQEIVAIYCSLLGNILHRQRAEAALRESERRFREMTDLLPDTIFETELDGLLTYANKAAFDLTGYDRSDLERGMRLSDLLSDDQLEKAHQCLEKIIMTGETDTAQYYLRRADGATVPVEVRTSARRGAEGAVIGFRGVVRDITERIRVEEAQRLASAGELAAAMAHEFGNILAGMRAWAQVYQRTNSDDAWDNLIRTVLRGSDRGGALCWNLLRLAHPSAPERQAINIESAIEAALSMAAPELEHHEVQVARNYETGPNGDRHAARVFADPAQMEQVFLNLIINACHAMPGGGQLTIDTSRLTTPHGNQVVVRVRDTGVGIRAEHMPRIFEPFFTTKAHNGNGEPAGHGLGLSVSYGIAQEHGGTLTVSSEVGTGTVFELRLEEYAGPYTSLPKAERVCAVSPRNAGQGQRILIVDDDEAVRSSLEFTLKAEGYRPTSAASTRQALDYLKQVPFDVLITDLILPGGGGAEIMASAKALDETLPVILMTGKAGETLAQELLSWGAAKCFHKPFDLTELLGTIAGLLREPGE